MPSLPTKSFDVVTTDAIAGIQGRAPKFVNFSEGSGLRAIVEGFAGVFLWFQSLALKVVQASRLSTSSGVDVDTFTADYMPTIGVSNGVASPRLGAQASSGNAVFARASAQPTTCFIQAGVVNSAGVLVAAGTNPTGNAPPATVKTNDGTNTSFFVKPDPTNGNYSSVLGGYTLAANLTSIAVPVQAVVPGKAGNVQSGAISVITSPITGIDTVTNQAAFSNGVDMESDSALKQRFSAYILGLSRGDIYGLTAAIEGAEPSIQWTLTEDYNLDGSQHFGFFFVIADDGSGAPTPAFLQLVTNAAMSVRPLSIQCAVAAPTVVIANVSMQLATLPGYDHNTVCGIVANTVATNINALGLGNALSTGQISAWAYGVAGVKPGNGVTALLLNGASGDNATIQTTKPTQDGLATINYITIKPGSVAVS